MTLDLSNSCEWLEKAPDCKAVRNNHFDANAITLFLTDTIDYQYNTVPTHCANLSNNVLSPLSQVSKDVRETKWSRFSFFIVL